ncbi:unnamed protein product [Kuraishia capsulata CBS 1993]|uniref:TLC domain-containing protein n=1 Tax=Kuraishia capsulata CBS 1993 TaxID=1382522 RepID=W6MSQ8_9ASCO|nr:uncharacterized protein KUCA_T00004249001 [Kuraishia capsulata CBS 1993]CDK28267.1 unnamed protein product [Kuraishia capsulata CBS 1993]
MDSFRRLQKAYAYDDPLAHVRVPLVDEYLMPLVHGRLQNHIHELVSTVILYQIVFVLARLYLRFLNPSLNKTISPKTRVDFSIRIVSMFQSIVILLAIMPLFCNEHLAQHRVFAVSPYAGMVSAAAAGYFVWDSLISLAYVRLFGIGYLIHGVVSSAMFLIGASGYIHFYAPHFLLFELSTPFLNVRWFALKFPDRFGPRIALVNNAILILIFFFVRIAWGWYYAARLGMDFYSVRNDPRSNTLFSLTIFSGNVVLDVLNVYWFSKMLTVAITTLKKMFKKDVDETKLKLI